MLKDISYMFTEETERMIIDIQSSGCWHDHISIMNRRYVMNKRYKDIYTTFYQRNALPYDTGKHVYETFL